MQVAGELLRRLVSVFVAARLVDSASMEKKYFEVSANNQYLVVDNLTLLVRLFLLGALHAVIGVTFEIHLACLFVQLSTILETR